MKYLTSLFIFLWGCAGPAEAKPTKAVTVKVALDATIQMCDVFPFIGALKMRFARDISPKLKFNFEFDSTYLNERPDLLTVESFWNGDLMRYWEGTVGHDKDGIRVVLIPALMTPQGPMYGGMASSVCDDQAFLMVNVEPGNLLRNASIVSHELAHALGARDHCDESWSCREKPCPDDHSGPNWVSGAANEKPHLMCWKYGVQMKTDPQIGFDWLAVRQIRECLGYGGERNRFCSTKRCRRASRRERQARSLRGGFEGVDREIRKSEPPSGSLYLRAVQP